MEAPLKRVIVAHPLVSGLAPEQSQNPLDHDTPIWFRMVDELYLACSVNI